MIRDRSSKLPVAAAAVFAGIGMRDVCRVAGSALLGPGGAMQLIVRHRSGLFFVA